MGVFLQKTGKLLAVIALLVVVAVIVLVATRSGGGASVKESISSAVEVLRQMESGDPDAVVQTIRAQQKARMLAEREDLRQKLLDGEIDVWSQFQDYLILGDSRASGYYYYSFLPQERCYAEAGDTVKKMGEHIPDVISAAPARIFVSYGINDINIGFWQTADEYCAEMVDIFDEMQESLPDLEIYVNSILEVQDWALSKGENWKYAPEWNEVIKQMCIDHGYTYIDNSQITAEHQDLYEGDGIHFTPQFYNYWATNMILATYYRGSEEEFE